MSASVFYRIAEFLSTPSARRATKHMTQDDRKVLISIHALRKEGDQGHTCAGNALGISIHALRKEGDGV